MLLNEFAGKNITMKQIFDNHHVNRPYVEKNYKDALKNLESEAKISVNPPATKRKKNTMADKVEIFFPPKQ